MPWNDDHMGGWGYATMIVGMLLFWGLLIAGIVFLVRYAVSRRHGGAEGSVASPERILAERFARGEIDKSEYENRLAVIRRGAAR
ncbi:SHOCT domain-containing protein [Micromonospora sp. NPDC049799]|uniref:SHOCT domain-containing protein n=1 Tax=Micromonospora sp. NPDC049799 TaxID=3154741 RepID=UPI0033D85DBE